MTSTSLFPRPDGLRPGAGVKPARVPTAALSDARRVIDVGPADVVRVQFASAMTLSAQLRFGGFDGQRVILVCLMNNGGARLMNAETNNVALDLEQIVDDWVPFDGDTLSLAWDARESVWRETGRASLG